MAEDDIDLEDQETEDDQEVELDLGLDDLDDSTDTDETDEVDDTEEQKAVSMEEFNSLKANYEKLENHKKDLNKALHGLRTEIKTLKTAKDSGDDDVEFTDQQLLGLMETHKDDPATLLQIMRHEATQAAKKAGRKTVNDIDVSAKQKDAERFLTSMYPDFNDDSSPVRGQVNHVKAHYGLDDNPMGDLYAAGVLALNHMPQIIKEAQERGKAEALGEKTEKARQNKINQNKPAGSGRKPSGKAATGLTGQFADTARQMNMTPAQAKIYAKMIGNKTNTVTVEG